MLRINKNLKKIVPIKRKSKKVVIFLLGNPLNKRLAIKIGAENYKKTGIEFIVFEYLCNYSFNVDDMNKLLTFNNYHLKKITSLSSFRREVKKLSSSDLYFIDGGFGSNFSGWAARSYIKYFTSHKLGIIAIDNLPKIEVNFAIDAFLKIRTFKGFSTRLTNLIIKLFFPKPLLDFAIVAGSYGNQIAKNNNIKNIINTYADDFEKYKIAKNDPKGNFNILNNKDFIVFLDNGLYVHPDESLSHLKVAGNVKQYVSQLILAFDRIEKISGKRLLIAAHPKISNDHYKRYYKNFSVFHGETANLVLKSSHVFVVNSSSINFAVLANKPVSFLTNENLKSSYIYPYTKKWAQLLGANIYNLNDIDSISVKNNYNEKKYKLYIDEYLKYPGTPTNVSKWKPFIDWIHKY